MPGNIWLWLRSGFYSSWLHKNLCRNESSRKKFIESPGNRGKKIRRLLKGSHYLALEVIRILVHLKIVCPHPIPLALPAEVVPEKHILSKPCPGTFNLTKCA